MKGVVEIIYPKYSLIEGNMIMDSAGELFADIMTVSPSLSSIPSASAILDASNYTIHALTFGKDASGYFYHAHVSSFVSETDGFIRVLSYESTSVSSYHSSATPYNKLPEYPSPLNTRLETCSTICQYGQRLLDAGSPPADLGPLTYNTGHNLNAWAAAQAAGNTMGVASALGGCYPKPNGTKWYLLSSMSNLNTPICSGIFSSVYNSHSAIDVSGFINMTVTSAAQGNSKSITVVGNSSQMSGLMVTTESAGSTFSSTGRVIYTTQVSGGDFGALAFYGGIYQMGLWYIDMKTLLSRGQMPPYSFSILNNSRRYKLFAKKTFNKDLTYVADTALLGGISGHRYISGMEALPPPGMTINWYISLL